MTSSAVTNVWPVEYGHHANQNYPVRTREEEIKANLDAQLVVMREMRWLTERALELKAMHDGLMQRLEELT